MTRGSFRRKAVLIALITFVATLPVLYLHRADSTPHYAISKPDAARIARADSRVANTLRSSGYSSVRVTPVDGEQQRVSFFNGARLVLNAMVGPQPRVTRIAGRSSQQLGNTIANEPALLICLAVLFVLATATVPVFSLRNLDVLAFAGFTLPIWLVNEGFIDASVLVAYLLLAYLTFRLLRIGLTGDRPSARASLYWSLTHRWDPAECRRVLTIVLVGLAVLTTTLIVTSTGVNDVAYAALAGGTDLLHGASPYGHIPSFIVHGDTYPPLTYAAYAPAAVLTPVTDAFSDPEGALVLTAAMTLLLAWGLYRVVARAEKSHDASQSEPPSLSGMRGAIACMAYPPALLAASGGTNDVVLAVFLVAALASFVHRSRSAVLVAVAAWVKFVPVIVLPIWLARLRGRELLRAIGGIVALSLVVLAVIAALGGIGSIGTMTNALSYQFDRSSLSSLWAQWGLGSLQPLAQAALCGVVVGATLLVRWDDRRRDDLQRLAALLAGTLLLAQFAANYWTWAYAVWVLAPALVVLIPTGNAWQAQLAPELSVVQPRGHKFERKPLSTF